MSDSIGHFSLWGDFEAEEIAAALGLEPSCVYPKGTLFEGADFPAPDTTWDYYCPADLSMEDQIAFVLDLLWPRAAVLQKFSERFKADLNVVDKRGVMTLKPQTLQKLATLGVSLNCFYGKDDVADAD